MNYFIILLILGVIFSSEINCRTDETLRVKLSNGGSILGRYLSTYYGKGVRGFLGIPYAEPPVGDLRFKVNIILHDLSLSIN